MEKVIQERKTEFWGQERFHDIGFSFPDTEKILHANRMILALCSPVFEKMFFGELAEKHNPVPIVDVDPSVFEAFLKFIYTGEFRVETLEEAQELFYVGHKYEVRTMEAVCEQYMIQNLPKFDLADLEKFADMFSMQNLVKLCRLHANHHVNQSVPANWVKYKKGDPIPEGAIFVENRSRDGWPIGIGRVQHATDILPGTLNFETMILSVCYAARSHHYDEEFEILCNGKLEWIATEDGKYIGKSVQGNRTQSHETLYIGKVLHEGKLYIGKVHPSHRCLYIPFGECELRVEKNYFQLIDTNFVEKRPSGTGLVPYYANNHMQYDDDNDEQHRRQPPIRPVRLRRPNNNN